MASGLQAEHGTAQGTLGLAPFEKYMLWDDSSQTPMTPVVDLDFDDRLNSRVVLSAFRSALKKHPLLRSRVQVSGGQWSWQTVEEARLPKLDVFTAQVDTPASLKRIDLETECGVRGWLMPHAGGKRLRLQWHHACCDGVGMRAFLVDFLLAYSAQSGNDISDRVSEYDETLLPGRGDFSNVRPKEKISAFQRLRNAYYFHFQLPEPLRFESQATATDSGAGQGGEPDFPLHFDISMGESQRIIEQCRSMKVSISELAIGLLFKQCQQWNQRCGGIKKSGRLRLLIPYDLRAPVHLRMSAANRMSFAFIGRNYGQTEDVDGLIEGIRSEMASVKRTQLPLDFLGALGAASKSPRAMRWLLSNSSCMATAVLTYTGEISRGLSRQLPVENETLVVGPARLRRIGAAPPARLNTKVAVGLCQNWGKLCFSASYCAAQFSRPAADQFLREYVGQWSSWLDGIGA